MSAICPTCRQSVPGLAEPADVGTIVSCSCGDAFARLKPAPQAKGVWHKVGARSGRSFWITVLAEHGEHTLTVVHVPRSPGVQSEREADTP